MSAQPPPLYTVRWHDSGCRLGDVDTDLRAVLEFGQENLWFDPSCHAARRFFHELNALLSNVPSAPGRLLPYRADFRRILRRDPVAGLMWGVACGHPPANAVAVWLLGRCCWTRAARLIGRVAQGEARSFRKHAVKALRRLGAAQELQAIAESEQDPEVLRLCRRKRAPYTQRLARFMADVEPLPEETHPRRRMSFWSLVPMPITSWIRPKSTALIREILERIRRLVHGSR